MAMVESSSRKRQNKNESGLDFISAVPNEILLQIFLRLPQARSVIRCGFVCKRWSSLVSSLPNDFIRRFIQYHKGEMSPSDSWPYTMLLFLFDEKLFYQLFSNGSKILHRRNSEWSDSFGYLDFLPWPRVHVCASFDDLLLVTTSVYDPRPLQHCICNSVTKKWLVLPQEATSVPNHPDTRHGLVCKSNNYNNDDHDNNIRYKVVRLNSDSNSISRVTDGYLLPFSIFCSESGRWSQSTLFAPSALDPEFTSLSEPIATSNGMLHFPLISEQQRRGGGYFKGSILSFDPFDNSSTPDPSRGSFIDKPAECVPGSTSSFGVVKGQLRHMQYYYRSHMKIWQLNYEQQNSNGPSAASWALLYDGNLRMGIPLGISATAFDPENGGVVFLMTILGVVFKYKIEEGNYEEIGEIPFHSLSQSFNKQYRNYFRSFTLVHPIWPTPIPTLPTS